MATRFFLRLTCYKYALLVLCLAVVQASAQAQASKQAKLHIKVQDDENGESLPGVVVSVKESNKSYSSGKDGYVDIMLPAGSYTLLVRYVGFKTIERKVSVSSQAVQNVKVGLRSSTRNLAEVTVEARRKLATEKSLLILRSKSANIQDGISQQQIERAASINTAQALQKVTGVTLRDGKYITVRGLTDRNLVIELNGARLAGADAARSAVSLDLVPAPLLDNIIVQKSVTPDKPGDANGAVIEIKTKSIPDSSFLSINAQTGYNGNIGVMGFSNSFSGDGLGALGFRVEKLNIPASYSALIDQYQKSGNYQVSRSPELFKKDLLSDIDKANTFQSAADKAAKIQRAMRDFDPTLTTRPAQVPVNQLYTIAYGNRYKVFHGRLVGLVLGVNYYNRYASNPNGQTNRYSINEISSVFPNIIKPNENQLINLFRFRENTGNHQLSWGGFTTLSFRLNPSNEISFTYNGSYGAESNATTLTGTNNPALQPVAPSGTPTPETLLDHTGDQEYSIKATQRDLHSLQLKGEHAARLIFKKPLKINWSASRSYAWQNDPSYRDTRLFYDSLGRVFSELRNPNNVPVSGFPITYNVFSDRYYRTLHEQNVSLKLDIQQPFRLGATSDSYFKFGGNYFDRKRQFREISSQTSEISNIISTGQNPFVQDPATYYYLDPKSYLTKLHGDLEGWSRDTRGIISDVGVTEGSGKTAGYLFAPRDGALNSYKADYKIIALYGMADLVLGRSWRAVGGVRVENTDLRAQTDTAGVNIPKSVVSQTDFNARYRTNFLTYTWLPSGSLIYNGIQKVNVRLAYSKTVQRPELNEAIRSAQFDVLQQAYLVGNNKLRNGGFQSFDFRTDFFPTEEELFSASFFYKQAKDVLERVFYPARSIDPFGRSIDTISFRNNPNPGNVVGIELDIRRRLGTHSFMRHFSMSTNFFAAKSTTRITDAEYYILSKLDRTASRFRSLADQANYSANLSLVYENPKRGSVFSVFYNTTGKRLIQISADGSPNIYEFPAGSLDFIASQRLLKRFTFKFFAKNVLNETNRYYYTEQGFASKTYGLFNRTYLQRAFGYGPEVSFGLTYIL